MWLPEEAWDVMPLDAVLVLVVEDSQAGLVKELLESLYGEAAVVLDILQLTRLHIVGFLRNALRLTSTGIAISQKVVCQ